MKTTSLELSKKIFEAFPEWKETYWYYQKDSNFTWINIEGISEKRDEFCCPAYDTDFLLDKLGAGAGVYKDTNGYTARRPNSYGSPENKDPLNGRTGWQGGTAAEALGNLALALKEKGLL